MTQSNQRPPFFKILVFVLMMVAYAFWSSSTPDEFGVAEAVIGVSLLLFVGLHGGLFAFGGFMLERQTKLPKLVFVCFLGLLFIPLIWGLFIRQNSLENIVRDVVPLLYFFLPVFFIPQMSRHTVFWKKICVTVLCVIGVAYSIRFFISAGSSVEQLGREIIFGGDNSYFPMDPAVLFASTFLLTYSLMKLLEGSYVVGISCLFLGGVVFACLVAIIVRAQIALVLFSLLLAILFGAKRAYAQPSFWFGFVVVLIAVIAALSQSDIPAMIYQLVTEKSEGNGLLNSRDMEAAVVFGNAFSSAYSMLLGEGWGGLVDAFSSGEFVRYTHNVFLYFVLKGGLVGLIIGLAYCFQFVLLLFGLQLQREGAVNRAVILGISNVLFLELFLEPGYKMFSFGMVLTLLWLIRLEGEGITPEMSSKNDAPG